MVVAGRPVTVSAAMLLAVTLNPGPLFPGDKNLLAVLGAAYAFGYLIAAVVSNDPGPRSEIMRRRAGAMAALVLGGVWLVSALTAEDFFPLLPRGDMTLLDAAAAFSIGPLVATLSKITVDLSDPQTLHSIVDRRGTYIGVISGVLALGVWLAGA